MNPVVIHRQAATSYKNCTETDKQSSLEGTSSPLQTQRSSVCKDCRFERLFVAAVSNALTTKFPTIILKHCTCT